MQDRRDLFPRLLLQLYRDLVQLMTVCDDMIKDDVWPHEQPPDELWPALGRSTGALADYLTDKPSKDEMTREVRAWERLLPLLDSLGLPPDVALQTAQLYGAVVRLRGGELDDRHHSDHDGKPER